MEFTGIIKKKQVKVRTFFYVHTVRNAKFYGEALWKKHLQNFLIGVIDTKQELTVPNKDDPSISLPKT